MDTKDNNNSQRALGITDTERKCADLCIPLSWRNYYTWFDVSNNNVNMRANQYWG